MLLRRLCILSTCLYDYETLEESLLFSQIGSVPYLFVDVDIVEVLILVSSLYIFINFPHTGIVFFAGNEILLRFPSWKRGNEVARMLWGKKQGPPRYTLSTAIGGWCRSRLRTASCVLFELFVKKKERFLYKIFRFLLPAGALSLG